MTEAVTGLGVMRHGRLCVRRAEVFSASLATLRDGVVEISLQRRRATRNPEQNAFYWVALVQPVAEQLRLSPRQVHELFRVRFLPQAIAVPDGVVAIGGVTTRLTVPAFTNYCQRIEQWMTTVLGLTIPPREEMTA